MKSSKSTCMPAYISDLLRIQEWKPGICIFNLLSNSYCQACFRIIVLNSKFIIPLPVLPPWLSLPQFDEYVKAVETQSIKKAINA